MSNNISPLFRSLLVAGVLAGVVGSASAATYCSSGSPHPDGLLLSDVTLAAPTPVTNATDCYGVIADNINQLSDYNNLALTWGSFSTFGSTGNTTDPTSVSLGAYSFILTPIVSTTSFTLDVTGGTLPAYFDFVFALKAGSGFALYYFNDFKVEVSDVVGEYTISFQNPNGNSNQNPGLSHLAMLVRDGTPPDCAPTDPLCNPQELPEPGALSLIGLAMLGLGGAQIVRRRQRKQSV